MYRELDDIIARLTEAIQELTRRTNARVQKEEADALISASLRRSVRNAGPRTAS